MKALKFLSYLTLTILFTYIIYASKDGTHVQSIGLLVMIIPTLGIIILFGMFLASDQDMGVLKYIMNIVVLLYTCLLAIYFFSRMWESIDATTFLIISIPFSCAIFLFSQFIKEQKKKKNIISYKNLGEIVVDENESSPSEIIINKQNDEEYNELFLKKKPFYKNLSFQVVATSILILLLLSLRYLQSESTKNDQLKESTTSSSSYNSESILSANDRITFVKYLNNSRKIEPDVNSFTISFLSKTYPNYTLAEIEDNLEELLSNVQTFYSFVTQVIVSYGHGEKERSILMLAGMLGLNVSSTYSADISIRIYEAVYTQKKLDIEQQMKTIKEPNYQIKPNENNSEMNGEYFLANNDQIDTTQKLTIEFINPDTFVFSLKESDFSDCFDTLSGKTNLIKRNEALYHKRGYRLKFSFFTDSIKISDKGQPTGYHEICSYEGKYVLNK